MKYLSCYKVLASESGVDGGLGQGGGTWFTDIVGIKLQQVLAELWGAELVLHQRPHGQDSYHLTSYEPPDGEFDIAYVQLFDPPSRRPGRFVWSMISDYIRMEDTLEVWLEATKPNLLVSLQYPLQPPRQVHWIPFPIDPPNLVDQCARHGCHVVFMPWFNEFNVPPSSRERDITAMCTGKISASYPSRYYNAAWLRAIRRPDVIVSCGADSSRFSLTYGEYLDSLRRCRYYVSGGIYDFQVPPKYFEVANYGACLVCVDMPTMKDVGFVDGVSFISITSPQQLTAIIDDPLRWKQIGEAAREMVQRRHHLAQRAKEISEIILEML